MGESFPGASMARGARRGMGGACILAVAILSWGCADAGVHDGGVEARSAAEEDGRASAGREPDPAATREWVADDRGVHHRTARPRSRVVSLVPALTETVLAFDGAEAIVGRTRFDQNPRLARTPSVGGSIDPDVEAILGLRPDLVVTWLDADARALTHRLDRFEVPVYAARLESISDFDRHARALGSLLGRTEEADAMVKALHARLDGVRAATSPSDGRPSVLFVAWPRPLLTAGGGTFVTELIRIAGGRGTFDDLGDRWPSVSMESVLARQPDVVVLARDEPEGGAEAWLEADPSWRAVRAVREGRLYVVDADLFVRPGPGMAEAAETLATFVRALGGSR